MTGRGGGPHASDGRLRRYLTRTHRRWRNLRHVWPRTDWRRLRGFLPPVTGSHRIPLLRLLRLQLRHGASPDDAVELRLLGRPDCEVATRVTQGRRHEFTVATSEPSAWVELEDKWRFAARFHDVLGRRVVPAPRALMLLEADPGALGPEMFVKRRFGQVSVGQYVASAEDVRRDLGSLPPSRLADLVVEEVIPQHPDLDRLLPGVVFTLRMCTFLAGDRVEVWPVRMRLGFGGVDAQGRERRSDSIAGASIVAVDEQGRLGKTGLRRDPGAPPVERHPVSGVRFSEVVVPYFDEAHDLVRAVARRVPAVRSVGWDVAITPTGPVLVEGNHNWSSFVLELPGPPTGQGHLLTAHTADAIYGGTCRHCRRRSPGPT